MKPRKNKAHLGVVCHVGVKPVKAWYKNGRIYFHKSCDRDAPSNMPMTEIYKLSLGELPLT